MKKSEKTRAAIVDAATQLFFKKGFAETTFADISKDVGVSQPALYGHFKNKMDLLENVSLDAAEKCRQFVKNQVNPKDSAEVRLQSYLLANLSFFRKKRKLAHAITALYFFSSSSKKILGVFSFVQEKTIDQIETILVQGVHEKVFHFEDTRSMARMVHSAMVGECYKMIFAPSAVSAEHVYQSHWPLVQQLLGTQKPKNRRLKNSLPL